MTTLNTGRKARPRREASDEICHECAVEMGWRMPHGHLATVYMGVCPRCQREKALTSPRDYIRNAGVLD